MPKRFRAKVILPAALALLLAAAPVTAYAAGAEQPEDGSEIQTEQGTGGAVHKYVISNKNADADYRHDKDCRQDIDGRSVAPGDPDWPDEIFDLELTGEYTGHHDGRCYKLYIDDPTVPRGDSTAQKPEDGSDPGDQPDASDGVVHDGNCVQNKHLVCENTDPDHVHDDDCYQKGNVNQNGWEHDESCIKQPYKPELVIPERIDSSVSSSTNQLGASAISKESDTIDLDAGIMPIATDPKYQDLPATGGLGIGLLTLFGIGGATAGTAGFMASRKRRDVG